MHCARAAENHWSPHWTSPARSSTAWSADNAMASSVLDRGSRRRELEARYRALQAEWDEHVAGRLLLHGGWLHDCEQCKPHAEPHHAHATEEEWDEHHKALMWLNERAVARVGTITYKEEVNG